VNIGAEDGWKWDRGLKSFANESVSEVNVTKPLPDLLAAANFPVFVSDMRRVLKKGASLRVRCTETISGGSVARLFLSLGLTPHVDSNAVEGVKT
jgi:hypothetical protein